MKTLLISWLATIFFRSARFDYLDLASDKFDITWDEIIDDLTTSFP